MDRLENDPRIRELNELIQKEQDPHRLAELADELSRILDGKLHPSEKADFSAPTHRPSPAKK
jgi:hypothetical protein